MSLGEANAKFPGSRSATGLPPSPSPENPGQVYPKSDPKAAPKGSIPGTGGGHEPTSILGNPFAMRGVFDKLDHALTEAITAIESEEKSVGSSGNEMQTVEKLKSWQRELVGIRGGREKTRGRERSGTPQEGGLFTD